MAHLLTINSRFSFTCRARNSNNAPITATVNWRSSSSASVCPTDGDDYPEAFCTYWKFMWNCVLVCYEFIGLYLSLSCSWYTRTHTTPIAHSVIRWQLGMRIQWCSDDYQRPFGSLVNILRNNDGRCMHKRFINAQRIDDGGGNEGHVNNRCKYYI